MAKKSFNPKSVESLKHDADKRKNIPTAEYQAVLKEEEQHPVRIAYERRNRDLDPQLVWRGKDEQDWSDLVVHAPPLYIQEKVHPKVLIDDLLRQTKETQAQTPGFQTDLFADFNGIPKGADKTEFYAHDQNWSNRMILGDSLQVMASLAEREGLRGKVQCIYFDPPYGIKFNSNFQWSTTSRDVKDGNAAHITREPEQVKAFRDTWRDGIHSYLTYLRDRLTVARDLLSESGSIFVQIGDENVHRVRAVMDEVFGEENFCAELKFKKTSVSTSGVIPSVFDTIVWFAKDLEQIKIRQLWPSKEVGGQGGGQYTFAETPDGQRRRLSSEERLNPQAVENVRFFRGDNLTSSHEYGLGKETFSFAGHSYSPNTRYWSTSPTGLKRLASADRLIAIGNTLSYVRYIDDFSVFPLTNFWGDTAVSGFAVARTYVVQTTPLAMQRCILMTTDPGDLVVDPTCGSGTTATVAEQWGRRWITIDTSRVALALARARIMGGRYPFFLLADSRDGQLKEAEVTRTAPSSQPVHGNIRHGFVYERVPHITLKSIAHNAEIDVIWDKWQAKLEPLRETLNSALQKTWQEWEIPREAEAKWPIQVKVLHADWWQARIARQQEIDKSIAAKAEFEYLYDKPYEDKKVVRVAGPFTVESLSPHRVLGVDENDDLIDPLKEDTSEYGAKQSFPEMILENLKTAGVQQAHKADRITFTALDLHAGNILVEDQSSYNIIGPRFVFRVTDFGVGDTTSEPRFKDDYLQVADTLAQLLRMVNYQVCGPKDKFIFNALRHHFLARHLVESDPTFDPLAKQPRDLLGRLQRLDADFQEATAQGSAPLLTPFDFLSCEQIGEAPALLRALYSDLFLGLSEIQNQNNIVVTGPRGCGKSTVFRSLSLDQKMRVDEAKPDQTRYLGVYYRCDDLYFAFPRYIPPTRDEALDIPIHFVTATLLATLLDSLEAWARQHFTDEFSRAESRTAEGLWTALGIQPPHSPGYATFKAVVSALNKERAKAAERHRFVNDTKRSIGRCFGAEVLQRACGVLANNLPFVRERPIYFFIDDYSSPKVTKALQMSLNRVLMQRTAVCFFKISTESPVSFARSDIDGKDCVEGREFILHNLGLVYLHAELQPKLSFIEDVFRRRLNKSAPEFPARELQDLVGNNARQNNNELARGIRNGEKPLLWGKETLCKLCSGDIHYLISLVGDMVRLSGGPLELAKAKGPFKVPEKTQSQAIRDAAGSFLKNLRGVPRCGVHLVAIVEAFGNVANSHLKFLDSKNEDGSPPKQATRIEPYEPFALSEDAQRLYDELLRYSVFIEDFRGKSRRGSVVPRLYLRRFLIPHFNLTFSTRDSIELESVEFEKFLTNPEKFDQKFRLKSVEEANRLEQRQSEAENQLSLGLDAPLI